MGCQCVYPYIPRRVVSGARWATTHLRSIVPRERSLSGNGKRSHTVWHAIARVYVRRICVLLSIDRSPTTDSENFEIKSGDGAARERCIHRVYACTWYVCMSYWLKGWYTLGTWYSTILPIGYCIKFVPGILHCYSSKVELPQHTLLRTNFWHEIVGASHVWAMHTRGAERGRQETSNVLSRLRLWRLPYQTSYPGRFFFLTKEVAVCLHSAQVTRREGAWVVVLFEYGTCWWTAVARNMRQK